MNTNEDMQESDKSKFLNLAEEQKTFSHEITLHWTLK